MYFKNAHKLRRKKNCLYHVAILTLSGNPEALAQCEHNIKDKLAM